MKTLFVIAALILFCSGAHGLYVYQVTTDDPQDPDVVWTTIPESDITYDVEPGDTSGVPKIHETVPTHNSFDDDDIQEWYVDAPNKWWRLVSFSASAAGIEFTGGAIGVRYFFRYAKQPGGWFSPENSVTIIQPGLPIHQ